MEFVVGEKVTYITSYKKEHGIVKSIRDGNIFVVYNCNEDWDNYKDYTAANTPHKMLVKEWI
jgi:hypothetical protein